MTWHRPAGGSLQVAQSTVQTPWLRLGALQVDVVVDFVPGLLGPTLIFFGLELVLVGTFLSVFRRAGVLSRLTNREQFLAVGGVAVGLLFAASGALRRLDLLDPYVVFLFALGRVLQGASAARFYRRILDVLRGRGGGGVGGRIRRGSITLFVCFFAGWLAVRVLTQGPIVGTVGQSLRLVWTGFVVVTTALGITWKLRHAEDTLDRGLRPGLVLCVTGAEVYNFASIGMELGTYLVGSVAFSLGFWVAVFYLFASETTE
jgi:hypothetical protein